MKESSGADTDFVNKVLRNKDGENVQYKNKSFDEYFLLNRAEIDLSFWIILSRRNDIINQYPDFDVKDS